jgi:putative ABC transport system substrate-binding protein
MWINHLGRRDFITALGGATIAWPLAARAQQREMPVIGFLVGASAGASRSSLAGFRQGLRQTGYIEGQNVHIAFRWAEGRYDRLPEMAAVMLRCKSRPPGAMGPELAGGQDGAGSNLVAGFIDRTARSRRAIDSKLAVPRELA